MPRTHGEIARFSERGCSTRAAGWGKQTPAGTRVRRAASRPDNAVIVVGRGISAAPHAPTHTRKLRMKPWKLIAAIAMATSCGVPADESGFPEPRAFHSGGVNSEEAAGYLTARLAYLTALAEYERGPAESRLRQMDAKSPDVAALARCEAAGEEYGLSRTLAEAADRMRSEARKLRDAEPPTEQVDAAEVAVREAAAAFGMAEDELRTAEMAVQRRATREARREEALERAEANLAAARERAQGRWEERRREHQAERQNRERELEAARRRLAELERELEPYLNSTWRSSKAESAHLRVDRARERVRQAEEDLRSVLRSAPPLSLSDVPDVTTARDEVARLAEEPRGHEADLSGLRETVGMARTFLTEKEGIRSEAERAWEANRAEIRERWRAINEDAEEAVRHASYRRDVADAALRRAMTEAMKQRRPGGEICSWRIE